MSSRRTDIVIKKRQRQRFTALLYLAYLESLTAFKIIVIVEADIAFTELSWVS